jgi:hypothetical protein
MHTSRHSRKNSSFSTQGEHLVLLGLEALTEASNLRYATRSNYPFRVPHLPGAYCKTSVAQPAFLSWNPFYATLRIFSG